MTQDSGADDQSPVGMIELPAHSRSTEALLELLDTTFNRARANR